MSEDDNVLLFPGPTTLDIPPDRVLEGAVGCLDDVILIGKHKDGSLYFASSSGDVAETLWVLEQFKARLLAGDFSA